jgi:hypothetical protein
MIRKIHLDFHTRPEVTGIGAGFDPESFADTLARAHVNALATPGKCQYGETYFDTALGHPHPGLVRPDLFPATVAACTARGIRVQAYFTLGLDDVAAAAHPEWRQRYKDGTYAAWGAKHICFASPYADEVVIPEALEMIERCPGIIGFWFDICLYCNGAFYSESFERLARKRLGRRAKDEHPLCRASACGSPSSCEARRKRRPYGETPEFADKFAGDEHQRWLLGRKIIRECCQRIDRAIRKRLPDAENYFNSLASPGEQESIQLQPIQEVENPIFFGGPELMTSYARWLRWHGRPVIGLVSRFQGPWMDPGTLRTPDQLRFDVGRAVALGCHVSMGDHRHPDGTLDPEVYRRIEPIYRGVEACEPWLDGAVPCREAVLVTEVERGAPHIVPTLPAATLHAARILEEIGVQFDIVAEGEKIPDAKFVITTGKIPVVKKGTALLVIGSGASVGEKAMSAAGHVANAGSTFFRCVPELGVGPFAHAITLPFKPLACGYRPGTAGSNAGMAGTYPAGAGGPPPVVPRLLARGWEILAEQLNAASVTPPCPGREALGPVIVQRDRVIHCAVRLFDEQCETGSAFLREVLRALCDRLLVRRLVRHDAGTSVAAHLHRAPKGYALHLLHWAIERWDKKINSVAEFPRLGKISVELAIRERVRAVTLQPGGKAIRFKQSGGVCRFMVPGMHVWQVLGVETEG